MATTIGFISEKGGVGKTTTCYHIAIALQRYNELNVLCVDTDYQRGGLTCRFKPDLIEHFTDKTSTADVTLYDEFQRLYSSGEGHLDVEILNVQNGLDLMPADPRLSQVTVEKLPASNNIRENNQRLWSHLALIDSVLQEFHEQYDYILIDSHPELSDLLRSVIYASDYCVSPVKLDLQSTIGVPSAQEAINSVNEDMEAIATTTGSDRSYSPTEFSGAIAVMTREYSDSLIATQAREYRRLQRSGGVFESYVTEGDGLRQAAQQRCPVFNIDGPNADKQSAQYMQVANELMMRCPP